MKEFVVRGLFNTIPYTLISVWISKLYIPQVIEADEFDWVAAVVVLLLVPIMRLYRHGNNVIDKKFEK